LPGKFGRRQQTAVDGGRGIGMLTFPFLPEVNRRTRQTVGVKVVYEEFGSSLNPRPNLSEQTLVMGREVVLVQTVENASGFVDLS
jgi:hypothetical protein